jgi:hypothetical protein
MLLHTLVLASLDGVTHRLELVEELAILALSFLGCSFMLLDDALELLERVLLQDLNQVIQCLGDHWSKEVNEPVRVQLPCVHVITHDPHDLLE